MKRTTSLFLAATLGLATALTGAAPAQARSGTAQVTMSCLLRAVGYEQYDPENYATGVSLQLTVPDSVQPGQTVSLRGVLALQFPEELRSFADSYVDTIDGVSDNISVRLGINGRTTKFVADRWQTGKTPIGNPMVIKAPISFPSFTVPAGSTGSITVDLPQNDVTPNTIGNSPKTVAFTGEAQAVGAAWNYRYALSCYRRDSGQGRIATIPIGGTAAAATGGSAATGPGAAAPGATSDATGAAPDAASSDPFAAAGNPAAAGSGSASSTALEPLASTTEGVRLPVWLLVVAGAAICVGAAVYSAWLHLRLRAVRSALD